MKKLWTLSLIISLASLMFPACSINLDKRSSAKQESGSKSDTSEIEKKDKRKKPEKLKDTSGKKEISSRSDGELPQKISSYRFRHFDFSIYLIPKNLPDDELIKIGRELHEQEPEKVLIMTDDSHAEQFTTFHRQLEAFENSGGERPQFVEYPFDWEKKHVVAAVNMFAEDGELKWYLVKGNYLSMEKISELE